jgi:hypothetical protein
MEKKTMAEKKASRTRAKAGGSGTRKRRGAGAASESHSRSSFSGSRTKPGPDKTKPDPVEMLQGFVKSTSRVVGQAAAILEEEIAAGVVAAKEVEDSIIPTDKIRNKSTEKLVQRFRQDSHEIVDIVMDFVSVAATKAEELTDTVVKIGGNSPKKSGNTAKSAALPTLVVPKSVKPGETAEASMVLENEGPDSQMNLGFIGSDLISSTGGRIASRNLVFKPEKVSLAPKAKGTIDIRVNVPKATSAGSYSGLIRASGMKQLRAEIVLEVTK